jgi:hypothetical protein
LLGNKDRISLLYDVDNENKMNHNSKLTISFVIAFASMLSAISPALPMLPAFAQSDGDDDSSGSGNYEEFVNCLAQSEGDKGYASESEIRDCFRPIYDPEAGTTGNSVSTDSSSADSTGSSSTTDSNSNDDSNSDSSSDDTENTSSNNR